MIFYTGGYTEAGAPALNPMGDGLSCYNFNENDGIIEFLFNNKLRNPSYLVISEDLQYLFVAEEMKAEDQPKVYAFRIEKNGKLKLVNSQYVKGDYPCHIAIIDKKLVLANYGSGSADSYYISKEGALSKCHQVIQLKGIGYNKERQEGPHAHMIFPINNKSFYLVDLGLDVVKPFFWGANKKWENKPEYDIHAVLGSGPRHLVMDKTHNYVFLLGELSSEVYVMQKKGTTYEKTQMISCIPKDYKGIYGAAAIRIHPTERFLFASCRGPDTISTFKIDESSKNLTLISHTPTGGKTPRDFNVHPSGKWLIVANQDSNNLVVFKIDEKEGTLTKHSEIKNKTPTNITWLSS